MKNMKIIDKKQDFYDYFQDYNSDIVFDRKGSKILTDKDICSLYGGFYEKFNDKFLLLQIGYTNWLIKLVCTEIDYSDTCLMCKDYKLELIEMWKDYSKSVDFRFGEIKLSHTIEFIMSKKFDIMTPMIDDIKRGNFEYKKDFCEGQTAILKETKITSILNPQDVFYAIEEMLSHKKDDVDCDKMTDKEKIISHGFDTKVSFRGKCYGK